MASLGCPAPKIASRAIMAEESVVELAPRHQRLSGSTSQDRVKEFRRIHIDPAIARRDGGLQDRNARNPESEAEQ